jgi:DNA repair protein RecO (recombination protein O)
MLTTTRAVILRSLRHNDHLVVLTAYTEAFGTRSCMMRLTKKDRSRQAAAQPLTRMELVVLGNAEQDALQLRDARVEKPYSNLHTDPLRSTLALFTQEVLYRALRHVPSDPALFAFVNSALDELDAGSDTTLFPQRLLIGLAHQLGFLPDGPELSATGFDLREGTFYEGSAPHELCLSNEQTSLMLHLMGAMEMPPVPATIRAELLEQLLLFMRLHVEGFGELRSLQILRQVLH